uniref:Uncharacterized protein n=1 Tax=Rhizophora mucronata TaxID=61149 RepID=A0A2P2PKU4_RHIMU
MMILVVVCWKKNLCVYVQVKLCWIVVITAVLMYRPISSGRHMWLNAMRKHCSSCQSFPDPNTVDTLNMI